MQQEVQPDWNKIAEKFDLFLKQLAPVGDALIASLDVEKGHSVLDVASGTGEPALTLAGLMSSQIELIGVDAAEGMTKAAKRKAHNVGAKKIVFKTMPAESLEFEDERFHRVMSRFGVMLFRNPLEGLKEMHRVLRSDGKLSIAVWHTPETMPTLNWSYKVFKHRVPEDRYPPLHLATSLGELRVLQQLMEQAGFSNIHCEVKEFSYQYRSFEEYWQVMEESEILANQIEGMNDQEKRQVKREMMQLAQSYISDNGFIVPHSYVVATARK